VVWLVIILLILLLLILAIIFTKLTVILEYYHGQDNDDLSITFKAWYGLIKYKISVPLIKIDKNSPSIVFKEQVKTGQQETTKKEDVKKFSADDLVKSLNDAKELLNHVFSFHKIVRKFLRKVSVQKIEWHTNAGIGDAAYTGMLIGALWTVKGGVIGIISNYMKLTKMPIISITPNFQRAISQTRITCMIQFRIGNAMLAGIKLVKFWKGGRPNFKSKPLSEISEDKTKTI
jgi:hypothetical protein